MTVEDVKKKLSDELDVINNSLKGRKSIESVSAITEIPTTNSKDDLFKCIKELYTFSRKALGHIQTSATESSPTAKDIESLIKKQLTDVLPGLLDAALQNHKSEVETLKEDKVKETTPSFNHTMDIEMIPVEGEEKKEISQTDWTTIVKTDVRGACKSVPLKKAAYDPTTGATRLHFDTKEHMDKAHDALKSKYKLTPKSEERKKLDPKITISGLDPEIATKEKLEEELLNKNVFIKDLKDGGELLKIVFLDRDERFAVVQVSPQIREAIRQNEDRVCIDLERYHVRDRIHVVQCYHCQEYGHMSGSRYCKQKESGPTCFYCSGTHSSKDCNDRKKRNQDKIKCSNCAKSKNRTERDSCKSHKASDNLCPFYVREKERTMSRTAGCEESKNAYLQRVKELQRKHGRV